MKYYVFKILLVLWALTGLKAYAGPCEEVVFSDLPSFNKAMTEGLALQRGQESLLKLYLGNQYPFPRTAGKHSLKDVFSVLDQHPNLSKPLLREQILEFPIIKMQSPQSLRSFISSFQKQAGQTRSNLFQIEENLGYWMKMTEFSKNDHSSSSLSKEEKRALKKQQNSEFISLLDSTPLNKPIRDYIKDETNPFRERAIILYKALEEIKRVLSTKTAHPSELQGDTSPIARFVEHLSADSKEAIYQNISHAMADLVHTVGFGNKLWRGDLKNQDPQVSFSALRNIFKERDSLAFELGFEGHWTELKETLGSKIPDETPLLKQMTEDIQNQKHNVTGTKTFRLRLLSLQESPFRSCLSGDCATEGSFEIALDPNFLYWTLTSEQHKSTGHITVVLGTAQDGKGLTRKVAFVDKIQNVDTQKLKPMLEGIRLSLSESGYVLALVKEEIEGDINGLSNDILVAEYVKQEIEPTLKKPLGNFEPHSHEYSFHAGPSRAYKKLSLWEFEAVGLEQVKIKPGRFLEPSQIASSTLNLQTLYDPILQLKESKKEGEQDQFLSHLLLMREIEELKISDQYVRDHLDFVMNDKGFSFRSRKKALWTRMEFDIYQNEESDSYALEWDFWTGQEKVSVFSEKERQALIGEMSNWRSTVDYRAIFMAEVFDLISAYDSRFESAFHSPWARLLDKDQILANTIMTVNKNEVEKLKVTQTLIEKGANANATEDRNGGDTTVLMWAVRKGYIEIAKFLIKSGAKVNTKAHGETALTWAIKKKDKNMVQLLIQNEADVNQTGINIGFTLYSPSVTPLVLAIQEGYIEIAKLLIKNKADVNKKNHIGETALMNAIEMEQKDMVQLLIQNKADVNAKNLENKPALIIALKHILKTKHTSQWRDLDSRTQLERMKTQYDIIQLLVEGGANVNANKTEALIWAIQIGRADIVQLLIKNGAQVTEQNQIDLKAFMSKESTSNP